MTPAKIKIFQRQHTDWLGSRLQADGLRGPKTDWALAVASLPAQRRAVISRAVAFQGNLEREGANTGHILRMWQDFGGARPGDPYCACALSWVLAGHCVPSAGALRLVRSLESVRHPTPGDAWAYPVGSRGAGHCGLVIGVIEGEILTWEANTSDRTGTFRRDRNQLGMFFGSPWPFRIPGVPSTVPMAGGSTR